MISRAFIHAYRIMQKIIENDGHNNHWLADGTLHCNIRRDFIDTKLGIAQRPIAHLCALLPGQYRSTASSTANS
jgi:hypothetical protein